MVITKKFFFCNEKLLFLTPYFNPFQCLNKILHQEGPLKKCLAVYLLASLVNYVPVRLSNSSFQFYHHQDFFSEFLMFYVATFAAPGGFFFKPMCFVFHSWLHRISIRIRNLSPGLENNHTLKCYFGNFPT